MTETVHACPPGLSGVTPCCGRTPFELPRTDRMTTDPQAVTCTDAPTPGLTQCPTCGPKPTEPHPRQPVDRCSNCKTHAPVADAASLTEKISPPWSAEQVDALNRFQREGRMHPFTCGGEHERHVNLVAHPDGWRCPDPGCGYTQDWAPAFMADPSAWPDPFGRAERLRTGRAGGLDPVPTPAAPACSGTDGFCDVHGFHRHAPAPDGLRDRYAAAMRAAVSDTPTEMDDGEETVIQDLTTAVLAVRDEELLRLRTEAATADQIRADVQRERDRLREELAASDETARRLLERHQELAEERYAWQERGDRAEATIERMKRTNRMVNGGARDARERAEKAEAANERVRALHDSLCRTDALTNPDDLITRGAAADRIATALDTSATPEDPS